MANCCHLEGCPSTNGAARRHWHIALWIALGVNAGMFLAELAAGLMSDSMALQADALDFLGDAANYGISLAVAGMALGWRAWAALLKGVTLAALGVWVFCSTTWHIYLGTLPSAHVMSLIGFLALMANGGVAVMLYRFRLGDANMRSVWICSRNDAIGNIAVIAAAAGVFGTGSAWPDLTVAAIMSALALWGGTQIVLHAVDELNESRSRAVTTR